MILKAKESLCCKTSSDNESLSEIVMKDMKDRNAHQVMGFAFDTENIVSESLDETEMAYGELISRR